MELANIASQIECQYFRSKREFYFAAMGVGASFKNLTVTVCRDKSLRWDKPHYPRWQRPFLAKIVGVFVHHYHPLWPEYLSITLKNSTIFAGVANLAHLPNEKACIPYCPHFHLPIVAGAMYFPIDAVQLLVP